MKEGDRQKEPRKQRKRREGGGAAFVDTFVVHGLRAGVAVIHGRVLRPALFMNGGVIGVRATSNNKVARACVGVRAGA